MPLQLPSEIPAQAIVAISTVVATLIAGLIAMVNLTLGKELKVSEMRQAWIDALRDDLAELFSNIALLVTLSKQEVQDLAEGREHVQKVSNDKVAEAFREGHRAHARVLLRLNVTEAQHIELARLLGVVTDQFNRDPVEDLDAYLAEVVAARNAAMKQAQTVLKLEWERVKRGEPGFVALRRWVVPALVSLSAVFVLVILFARFTK